MAPHILMIQRITLPCSDHAYCFRTLEFLCEEASAHRPAPLERLEQLCSDLLFERREAPAAAGALSFARSRRPQASTGNRAALPGVLLSQRRRRRNGSGDRPPRR